VEPVNLEPCFSTQEISGKCLKCLAEHELNDCLMALLGEEGSNKKLEQRFEALSAFLRSPESKALRDESERYLSEGKQVSIKLSFDKGQLTYELKLS